MVGNHLADSPDVVSLLDGIVDLVGGQAQLPQHPLQAVALRGGDQLLRGDQAVREAGDHLVVGDLELLQVAQKHLPLLSQAAMGNKNDRALHLQIILKFDKSNSNIFTSPSQSMKAKRASSRSRQGKGSFRSSL